MKHSTPIQLRFNDADTLGHINNAVYLSFFDLGKTDYFKAVKGTNFYNIEIDIVVAHIEVDFLKSVYLHEDVAVETAVTRIGNKSLSVSQRIISLLTNEIKCQCTTVMVSIDFNTGETKPISNQWRTELAAFESRPDFLPTT